VNPPSASDGGIACTDDPDRNGLPFDITIEVKVSQRG
jgi:hypothetical protein